MSISAEEYSKLVRRRNKFGAIKVKADGYTFDSKVEYGRYRELKLMQLGKVIFDLRVHPSYPFQIRTPFSDDKHEIWNWKADFSYCEPIHDDTDDYRVVAEDVKGGKITNTRESQRNHILFRILYPEIELRIVER